MSIVEECGECGFEIRKRVKKDCFAVKCPNCGEIVFLCDKCYDRYAVVGEDGIIRESNRPCLSGGECPAEKWLEKNGKI